LIENRFPVSPACPTIQRGVPFLEEREKTIVQFCKSAVEMRKRLCERGAGFVHFVLIAHLFGRLQFLNLHVEFKHFFEQVGRRFLLGFLVALEREQIRGAADRVTQRSVRIVRA
jgi:hypothetical protein